MTGYLSASRPPRSGSDAPPYSAEVAYADQTYPVAGVAPHGLRLRRADVEGWPTEAGRRATLLLRDPHGEAHLPVSLRLEAVGERHATLVFVDPTPFLTASLAEFAEAVTEASTPQLPEDHPDSAQFLEVDPGPLLPAPPKRASFFEEISLQDLINTPSKGAPTEDAPADPFAHVDLSGTAPPGRGALRTPPPARSPRPGKGPAGAEAPSPAPPPDETPDDAPVPVTQGAERWDPPKTAPQHLPRTPKDEAVHTVPPKKAEAEQLPGQDVAPAAAARAPRWPLLVAVLVSLALLGVLNQQRRWIESPQAALHGAMVVVGAPLGGVVESMPPRPGAAVATGSVLFEIAESPQGRPPGQAGIRTVTRARGAGRVVAFHRPPGTRVSPGDPVLTIEEQDGAWVLVALSVSQARRVEAGARAEVRFFELEGTRHGVVRAIGDRVPEIRSGLLPAGAVPVQIALDEPVSAPLGTGAEVRIRTGGWFGL